MHRGFWWGNLNEEGRMGDIRLDERIIIKWILRYAVGGRGRGLFCSEAGF